MKQKSCVMLSKEYLQQGLREMQSSLPSGLRNRLNFGLHHRGVFR